MFAVCVLAVCGQPSASHDASAGSWTANRELEDARLAALDAHARVERVNVTYREVAADARRARTRARDKEAAARAALKQALEVQAEPRQAGPVSAMAYPAPPHGRAGAAQPAPSSGYTARGQGFFCLSHCGDVKERRICDTVGCAGCPECERASWTDTYSFQEQGQGQPGAAASGGSNEDKDGQELATATEAEWAQAALMAAVDPSR